MSSGERVYVALGSNIGDRVAHLAYARVRLATLPGTRLLALSQPEETVPVGPVRQESYRNQMAVLETELDPPALLRALLAIERERGRERRVRWGPRTLDLDIVRYGARELNEPGLVIPHPELPHRAFWRREILALERARAAP